MRRRGACRYTAEMQRGDRARHARLRALSIATLGGLAMALLLALVVTTPARAAEVRDIRLGLQGAETRLVLETTTETAISLFGLADPYRIVVDLSGVDFALATDRTGAALGLVDKLRYGLFRPGTSRLVLDLKEPAKLVRKLVLRPEGGHDWRYVFDFAGAPRDEFLTSLRPARPSRPEPLPAVAVPAPRPSHDTRPVIVVDAGHGGVDPGAIGPSGAYEKTIVLDFAQELRRQLEDSGRYKVVMTRDRDIFLPLRERVGIAHRAGGALFVSLHVNTNPSRNLRGLSVYTLSRDASDDEAAALAALENKSDVIGGVDLDGYPEDVQNILIDFAQAKTNEQSVRFARDYVIGEAGRDHPLLVRPWRSAGFAVLKSPEVPSVLIELGYLSNREDERQLQSAPYRRRLTGALVRAIDRFFGIGDKAS
ncbi:MAG: N-acetylmuramoyl-L-alanine amidase [Alphaproteobacteria bacterium]